MRIEIERVLQKLPLSEYAPEYGEKSLVVWVNPSRKALQARMEQSGLGQALREELDKLHESGQADIARVTAILEELKEIGQESLRWMSEILSQGTVETHVSLDELVEFIEQCEEHDPRLYPWISLRVWEMISEHRAAKKKA